MKKTISLLAIAILFAACFQPQSSHIARSDSSATLKQAAAYYFYWYLYDTLHFYDSDGSDALTDHPPDEYLASTAIDYSFADADWHYRELLDLMEAGIEVVLPVYWGDHTNTFWSQEGIRMLVQAVDRLISEGQTPPQIGMFYDTTSLLIENGNTPPDLTTSAGKELFYRMIADFFALIPDHSLWARLDGKPVIYLYGAVYVSDYDQSTFDYVAAQFATDFGGEIPYIVKEISWSGVTTQGAYAWGAAVNGPNFYGNLAALGPGYDDSAVYGRVPTYRARQCGEFYQDSWELVIDSSATFAALETWNEFHEGTDIAASREYDRQYIDLTAENIQTWKAAEVTARPYAWIDLGPYPYSRGLRAANSGDGTWKTSYLAGRQAAYPDPSSTPDPSYHIYLNVDDTYVLGQNNTATPVWVMVEYFDGGSDTWFLQYDSVGPDEIPYIFKPLPPVTLQNTHQWKRIIFPLPDAYFANRQQNGLADFRLVDGYDGISNYFGRVWVFKTDPTGLHAPDLTGLNDLLLMPGADLEILIIPTDPLGDALTLTMDRSPGFAELLDNHNGTYTLRLQPGADDASLCEYRLRLLVADSALPTLYDAVTIAVRVTTEVTFLPMLLR